MEAEDFEETKLKSKKKRKTKSNLRGTLVSEVKAKQSDEELDEESLSDNYSDKSENDEELALTSKELDIKPPPERKVIRDFKEFNIQAVFYDAFASDE
jgi:hypothetical protein